MSVLYRLDASIRADGSVTRSLAESFQAATLGNFEDVSIIKREIGLTPLPSTAWAGAVFGPYSSLEQRLPEQTEGMAIAAELADELIAADAYVFAVPFYNFGVSQHFKAYVDIVLASHASRRAVRPSLPVARLNSLPPKAADMGQAPTAMAGIMPPPGTVACWKISGNSTLKSSKSS